MKFLLVLVALYALWWLLRRSVAARRGPPSAPPVPPVIALQTMEVCAQCGLHLPRDEAVPGRGGLFCSEPHRVAYERAHPER